MVAHAPVPDHAIPNGLLDPERMIYYGGTAAGKEAKEKGIQFFAYDVRNKKLFYSGPDGPARYMILAHSTGRLYYVPDTRDSPLMRFDPAKGGSPVKIPGTIGIRAATEETPQGIVYTVSTGQGKSSHLYLFNTKTEETRDLGTAPVAFNTYIGAIDADPTGRYLYYVPGAHGGSERDRSAVVQYDVKTGQKKVIAFLHPFYQRKYGLALAGTYSVAVDAKGERLFITWNVNRGGRAWDSCGLTTIHIPVSERQP